MTISTIRLIIREISWDDAEHIHAIHSIPEVDEYNTLGIPKDIEETKNLIRSAIEDQTNKTRKEFAWIVRLKESDIIIGLCGMFLSADKFKMGEIYYKLLPEHWGNGYATEIAKALVSFGFKDIKLHRIEAGTAVGNIKSFKVLEKIGMTKEGIRRKILPIRGEWIDGYQYGIVEDDKRDF
ncbi:MAG: GNAT family N-acetyltransferase [Bacteroidales bacterium]|nr:GNAT family N-acetyltransferase [Bacteroidales bacterium]